MFQFRENINSIKFIGVFLSYLSRRIIVKIFYALSAGSQGEGYGKHNRIHNEAREKWCCGEIFIKIITHLFIC